MSILRSLLSGLAASMTAAALVGLLEGLSIFASDASAGANAPLYGVVFYALMFAGAGLGAGLAFLVLGKVLKKDTWDARWVWTATLVATFVPLATVVARFRIIRDVFHEKLALASGEGVAVHVGLLVFAAVAGAGLWFVFRPGEKGAGKVGWPVLSGALCALMLIGGAPFALSAGDEAVASPSVPESAKDKPPVILIMVDTVRADHLTNYGYEKDTSPNLVEFGADSVQFDQAFAQSSWTRPSTATILSGLPPSAHNTMYKADRLPEGVDTVAEAFKAEGYVTGGRVTNYNIAPYFNFGQGMDDYRYLDPEYYFWADEGSSKLSFFNVARILREKIAPSNSNPAHYYQDAEVTTDASIKFIDSHKDKPFFLFISYMDPHDPYFARPLSGEAYSRAATVNPDPKMAKRFIELYDGEITYWDEHFGRLVKYLKDNGLYDKAIIAVTSDHGEEFQEHGGWWHGTTLYEEQIHVPLIIKQSGNKEQGKFRADLAQSMDIAPTLAGAAGVKAATSWKGRNLFGEADEPAAVFSEEDHQGNVLRALRGKDWKLIEANAGNPRGLEENELYEIQSDPKEKSNVAAKEADKVKELKVAIEAASKGAAEGAVKKDEGEVDAASQELLKNLGYAE